MQSAGDMFTRAAAPIRPLLALAIPCNYMIKGTRHVTNSLRVNVLLSPVGHCSILRHEEAAADLRRRASLKRFTIQHTIKPAESSVRGLSRSHSSDISQICTALALRTLGGAEECVLRTRCLPSHTVLTRRHLYWPPPRDQRSKRIKLPSGKKCFVFNAKRDQDGKLEPVVCFVDSQDNLLMWFDKEEFLAFETLIPRLQSYYQLWEAKAAQVEEAESYKEFESLDSPGLD